MRRKAISQQKTSRRTFIKGTGALVVSFSLAGALPEIGASAAQAQAQTPPQPQPVETELDSWIRIQADGMVKVFTGRTELGQGNRTALSQIVAEELDVPFDRIDMLMGDTALTPDQGATVGSSTIRSAGPQLRQAAAEARLTLIGLAAQQLNLAPDLLVVHDGIVSTVDGAGGSVSYADLLGDKRFDVRLQTVQNPTSIFGPSPQFGPLKGAATPKDPSQYRIVGTSVPRPDIQAKVTGDFSYVHDVRVPGMVHARVVRPTGLKSKLIRIDGFDPDVPGAQVVNEGDFVAVVADNEWDAIRAADALKVVWSDWSGLPDMDQIPAVLRDMPGTERMGAQVGDAESAIQSATTQLSATYSTAFEMHASIGASCAIADVQGGKATVWSAYQSPFWLKYELAPILKLDPGDIDIRYYEGSGCYGSNGAHIVSSDAAIISQLIGKPVRVQYSRADEFAWEMKGPATLQELSAGLDDSGNVVGWKHEVWTPPHLAHAYPSARLAGRPDGPDPPGIPATAVLLYDYPNVSILQHDLHKFADAIYTGWLRGPASMQFAFAMETFTDELAAAAGQDPVEFRLRALKDERLIEVLKRVTTAAGWVNRPSPRPDAMITNPAVGRGVALANYAVGGGSLVAEVAEVEVDRSTGAIRVTRFWAAQDCGLIINPKAVQAQIESNIIQATSRTLKEEVTFDHSNFTSLDWRSYPILTFPEVPQIETILINRPDKPATGAGESTTCPVSAAISNAVFDATGVRLRSTPFKPANVLAALAGSM